MTFSRTLAFCFFAIQLISGCNSIATKEQAFLDSFSQEDFSDFKNTSFFWRGRDDDDLILTLADRRLDSICSVSPPLTLISVDANSHRIKRIRNTFKPPCTSWLSKPQIERLAAKVIKYKVGSVHVDEHGNVTIGFQPSNFTSDDLVKVVDKRRMEPHFWQDYVQVRGQWYARKVGD